MASIRHLIRWLPLVFIVLSTASLSYAQWTESGGNITTSDNVGIGLTNPSFPLHISDGAVIGLGTDPKNFQIRANTPSAEVRFGSGMNNFRIGESGGALRTFLLVNAQGEVGIGTTGPANELHVFGANGAVRIQIGDGGHGRLIYADENNSAKWSIGYQDATGSLKVSESVFLDVNTRLTISSGGNIGVGTANPSAKLHVAGDATIDGNIAAKYQDVAEWVQTAGALEPGTVVVIDPTKDDQVMAASRAYDTRVAGVISSRPGIILGQAGEGKAKVAHSGRVKVKVDAQYGPIAVGDILASSATPGYAMRSSPIEINGIPIHRPGTILGKALEPLRQGKGEILVLLTLQ